MSIPKRVRADVFVRHYGPTFGVGNRGTLSPGTAHVSTAPQKEKIHHTHDGLRVKARPFTMVVVLFDMSQHRAAAAVQLG